jgi:prepilin-type processing-associated H-X9-DG protein
MHNYADANRGRFPADIVDKDGKPLLSWRVHLLPYLEQDQIYKQFKLDEPWDSPNNKPLIAKIPKVFAPPAQKSAAGTTTYLGPLGDGYLFRPKAKEGLKISDITDGTSNTIMIVETADAAAIEWTKPGDWTPDEKEPLKALIGHYPEGFNAAFCDGSVRFISKKVDPKSLLALLTTAGGEAIGEIP